MNFNAREREMRKKRTEFEQTEEGRLTILSENIERWIFQEIPRPLRSTLSSYVPESPTIGMEGLKVSLPDKKQVLIAGENFPARGFYLIKIHSGESDYEESHLILIKYIKGKRPKIWRGNNFFPDWEVENLTDELLTELEGIFQAAKEAAQPQVDAWLEQQKGWRGLLRKIAEGIEWNFSDLTFG